MALHGELKVNGRVIGRWYAQRVMTSQFGKHTYRWEAWSEGHHHTGDLRHEYADGAMALAAKVLTAAHAQLSERGQG